PFDILDRIAFAIESLEDLLALALTSRQFHTILSPKHLQYRILRCRLNRTEIWNVLTKRPGIA
ncbi:hypothetical protein M422DRAFT_101186, partial [Sphaerobolus stellatus SS14]